MFSIAWYTTFTKTWKRVRARRKGSLCGGERSSEEPQAQRGRRPKRRIVVRVSEIRVERFRKGCFCWERMFRRERRGRRYREDRRWWRVEAV